MKTRKNNKTPIAVFLKILHVVKLFHWNTKVFSQHKATDELYASLNESIDSYMEKYIGGNGRVSMKETVLYKQLSDAEFLHEIHTFKTYLTHLKSPTTDLDNIRDEILGHVNQFLYLWTLR
jgi:DNA-binding ferritin-like protein